MGEQMADYDVGVLGGGPSGYAAAMRLWDFGKRVCLVERSRLGGTGVHNGALSSKTMWELSRDYLNATRRDRGYACSDLRVSFAAVREAVHHATMSKVAHMQRQARELALPRPGHPGSITFVRGTAKFLDPHTIAIEDSDTSEMRRVTCDHFVIATGSRPRLLPSIVVDGEAILTSDHIESLSEFPRSLVILGAGVVGCEYATIFANYGQTKVYLIDRAERILPFEDVDVARLCSNNLERKGVTIHGRASLVAMKRDGDEVEYTIEHHTGGRETIRVEKALVSIGREPNTSGVDLAAAGVAVGPQGQIIADDTRTSVPHIYAAGDVTMDIALVNIGEIEGRHAAQLICGETVKPLSYDNLSTIMFLDPEVAAIGLNEQEAQKRRLPYRVAVYNYSLVNRAIAMRATDGFVKLLVTDDDSMRILGMRALGVHASTTIEAVSLMMQYDRSAAALAELLHPHPAVTEGLQDCVRMLMGTSIYKPSVFRSELRLSRVTYADDGSAVSS
ncbi:MAG TPA: NAD(P)/FAD-dependent oxidoreductase [Nannocystaceae bacterium]|nr:NAD(P)/FAD-dependent oxidoreductase [Nannocystaceae bacterium]